MNACGEYEKTEGAFINRENIRNPSLSVCICFFLSIFLVVSSSANAADLVLYYNFNTDSGGIVHDNSGHGNNGSVSGATFRSSDCGGAYEFDGVNDSIFISQSSSLSITGSLTLAAWMKVYSYDRQRPLLEWHDGISNSGAHMWTGVWGWQWSGNGTGANLVDVTGNQNSYVVSAANPPANQWQHLVVTYDQSAGIGRVYINGNRVAEKQLGVFTPKTALDLYIGKRPGQVGDLFYGLLDEIRVYNGALTSNEVLTLCLNSTNCEPTYGSALCAIEPSAVRDEGAQWRLTSGSQTNWNSSGATLQNLPFGQYTVEFKPVANWTAPISHVVTIQVGQTTQISGSYERSGIYSNTLVLYFDFNTYNGSTVSDLSGYGNDGIVSGATFLATDCGGNYQFDGVDDYIKVPQSDSLNITGSLSMAVWFKVYDYRCQRPLLEWHDGISNSGAHMWTGVWGWQWSGNGTGANLVDVTGNQNSYVVSAANPPANQWQHLVVTYDQSAGIGRVYINGNRVAEKQLGVFTPKTALDLYLGHRPGQGQDRLYGLLDEIRVYRGVLASNEIYQTYLLHTNCMQTSGGVTCEIQPAGARMAGAQWRLTSGPDTAWKNSGGSVLNLPAGNYTVNFKPMTSWNEPSNQAVSISLGQPTAVTGTYSAALSTTNTLVLHYNFNTNLGATVFDLSGNGNHGSVSGATYVASSCGGFYSFDGIDDFIFVPASASLNVTGSLSLAAWVNPVNYTHQRCILEWNDETGAGGAHMWMGVWGWQWGGLGTGANVVDENNGDHVVNMANPEANQWHHLVVTYDQDIGIGRVYLDGQLADEKALGKFIPNTSRNVYIGYRPKQALDLFYGMMDDIRIYRGALSASNVLNLFQTSSGCEPSMGIVTCTLGPAGSQCGGLTVAVNRRFGDELGGQRYDVGQLDRGGQHGDIQAAGRLEPTLRSGHYDRARIERDRFGHLHNGLVRCRASRHRQHLPDGRLRDGI